MSHLKIAAHSVRHDTVIVEVWENGQMIAAIYPGKDRAIRVISKHPMTTTGDTRPPGALDIEIGK